jgi:hypothetical protein
MDRIEAIGQYNLFLLQQHMANNIYSLRVPACDTSTTLKGILKVNALPPKLFYPPLNASK